MNNQVFSGAAQSILFIFHTCHICNIVFIVFVCAFMYRFVLVKILCFNFSNLYRLYNTEGTFSSIWAFPIICIKF